VTSECDVSSRKFQEAFTVHIRKSRSPIRVLTVNLWHPDQIEDVMHTRFLLLFPIALLAFHPAAQADFRLQPAPPSSNIPAPAFAMPSHEPEGDETGKRAPARPRFLLAQGFGHQVPVSFAVRQIVPHAIEVQFGPGVDRAAFVTWSGGRPWNRVLAAALRPLRLRMTTTTNSVMISH